MFGNAKFSPSTALTVAIVMIGFFFVRSFLFRFEVKGGVIRPKLSIGMGSSDDEMTENPNSVSNGDLNETAE